MQNQILYQKALNTEKEAGNLLDDRYALKLQDMETAQKRLENAANDAWKATINSGVLTQLDNVLAKVLELVTATGGWGELIAKYGGMIPSSITGIINVINLLSKSLDNPIFWKFIDGIKTLKNYLESDSFKTIKDIFNFGWDDVFKAITPSINEQKTAIDDLTESKKKLNAAQDEGNKLYKAVPVMGSTPFGPPKPETYRPDFDLSHKLDELNSMTKDTGDLMAKAAAETLNFSDIQDLIAKNPDFIDMISIQNGKIEINTDALRKLDLQKAKDGLLTAQQALQADILNKKSDETIQKDKETVDVMQAYVNAILDGTAYAEQLAEANKKAAAEAKKAAEEQLKIYEDEKKAADDLLKLVIDMIKQEKQAEIDHLNQQKQNYDELIDKRIQALDALKAENDYQSNLKKDSKKSADIKSQIAILKLDNSPEAKAKILKLQEDLANQTDKINKEIADHKLKLEKDALQQEKKRFDDSIKDKVQVIQNYLKQTGQIAQDAMELLQNHGQELYNRLLEWNRVYGDGIDQTIIDAWNKGYDAVLHYQELLSEISSQKALIDNPDLMNTNVIQPWKDATAAVQDYNKALAESLTGQQAADEWLKNHPPKTGGSGDGLGTAAGGTSQGDGLGTAAGGSGWTGGGLGSSAGGVKAFHSGLDVGPAGGLRTKDNDTIRAMLAPDEIVFNGRDQANLLHSFIPNIIKSTSNINQGGNTFKFDNLINIEGNADRTMIPDLNKLADTVIEKLNTATQNRGIKRPVNLFGNL